MGGNQSSAPAAIVEFCIRSGLHFWALWVISPCSELLSVQLYRISTQTPWFWCFKGHLRFWATDPKVQSNWLQPCQKLVVAIVAMKLQSSASLFGKPAKHREFLILCSLKGPFFMWPGAFLCQLQVLSSRSVSASGSDNDKILGRRPAERQSPKRKRWRMGGGMTPRRTGVLWVGFALEY